MNHFPIGKCVARVHAAMDQVHQCDAQVHEPFIKPWSLSSVLMALIKRTNRDERWGFIPLKEASPLGFHGGAMAKRDGSPEWGPACATVYGFQRF
jgi:hypothetical protein